jgi:N utilization substance protein A
VVDELVGERIDIVRWNDSLQVLVPNALQPAEVEDVILCPMLGKVIVLVQEDQLSLAIGKKGQNVRLASKLVGWDIHVMTQEKLDEQIDKSMSAFSQIPGVTAELAEDLVVQGFFTFDDLSVIEPDQLAQLGNLTAEECEAIIDVADMEAAREEAREREQARESARLKREQAELEAMTPPKPKASPEEAPEDESAQEADTHTLQAAEDAKAELETERTAAHAEAEQQQLGDGMESQEMALGERSNHTPELTGMAGGANGQADEEQSQPRRSVPAGEGSAEPQE